ncbi:MAG TPA: type II toxin-antitoxin system VapC family toxin [Terriglobia bacterium]|nr:type II toxin-antitoxin system VapC family toxin [Terriglobia bacterium]
MNKIVLDASALLAVLNQEPGWESLSPEILLRAILSTVNLAEVHTKLVRRGVPAEEAWEDATSLIAESVPFTQEHARIAGGLVAQTQSLGLSLGDRACLALALDTKSPVYTTDRSWKNLKVGVRIHVLR